MSDEKKPDETSLPSADSVSLKRKPSSYEQGRLSNIVEVEDRSLVNEVELGLRARAALAYIKSPLDAREQRYEMIMKDPEFLGIPRSKMLFWSRQDRWEEQRIEFQRQWTDRIKLQMGSNIAQALIKDFQTLTDVIADLTAASRFAEVSSKEAAVNVLIKALKERREIAKLAIDEVAPESAASPIDAAKKVAAEHGLNADALQDAARKLLLESPPDLPPEALSPDGEDS